MITVNHLACPQNHPCPVARLCPTGAITQKDFHSAPEVNNEACVSCMKCTRACGVFRLTDAKAS